MFHEQIGNSDLATAAEQMGYCEEDGKIEKGYRWYGYVYVFEYPLIYHDVKCNPAYEAFVYRDMRVYTGVNRVVGIWYYRNNNPNDRVWTWNPNNFHF